MILFIIFQDVSKRRAHWLANDIMKAKNYIFLIVASFFYRNPLFRDGDRNVVGNWNNKSVTNHSNCIYLGR